MFLFFFPLQTQLVHVDGSKSDTVIEVNLRHAGKQNRNVVRFLHFLCVHIFFFSVRDAVSEIIRKYEVRFSNIFLNLRKKKFQVYNLFIFPQLVSLLIIFFILNIL